MIEGALIGPLIQACLREDLGPGDVTTLAVLPKDRMGEASLLAREPLVLAGMPVFEAVFLELDPRVQVTTFYQEGEDVPEGALIGSLRGSLSAMLQGEGTALNFLQRMSGIATLTRRFVGRIKGTRARISDTRKTAPGLRLLDKYAVRMGGGCNHRFGLFDGVLIKDNHIAAAGSITRALELARRRASHTLKIEVEVEDLAGAREACEAGADAILLNNMSPETIAEAVRLIDGAALTEASGNITLDTVSHVAQAGVDLISVGVLTHSPRAADVHLEIQGDLGG